ncbi:Abscisic acid 8'-hydroxylase CYP707A2 [Linum grandiflorum]
METPYLCFYGALAICAIIVLFPHLLRPKSNSQHHHSPPGSLGFPLIGETIQFMAAIRSNRGFYDFVRVRSLRYGSCFKTNIFGSTHVFVSTTESARMILKNESGKFSKRYIRSIGELVGEGSVLCATSQQHHKLIRSRLMNLVSPTSLGTFITQFDQQIVRSLGSWENDTTVVLLDQALQITLEAMCKLLMGLEEGDEIKSLHEDVSIIFRAMLAFPLRLPWTRFSKGLKARERIMKRLDKMMSERREIEIQPHHQQDFLQQLMEGGISSKLTDGEIKDNILTMIIAGQDTTASAMTWMVKYLGENSDVADILRAEQLQILKRNSGRELLVAEDLSDMPYATKVIKESLRMASIVPWFPRLALQDCYIEGYKIMKGWNINVDARSIHFDPNLYKEPTTFNPSRFDDQEISRGCSTFLGFGMGGRTCLGINLAKSMLLVFLHRLLTSYKWKLVDSDSSIEKWAMFSRLKNGCPVHLTRITP